MFDVSKSPLKWRQALVYCIFSMSYYLLEQMLVDTTVKLGSSIRLGPT